ncbi:predicted protein [Lichtheimia corymbifera JMRC:FSU:9682]|uniref:Uncharacterized protein n=1 Tax=Lichtheimia corymbifera JMRC:FSU:9682 TaxID=1263082 RepID=A0A068S881_9FUNG|nr:predicted protein [Lichtheimia corymbifera JMRC:FSU:9682]
MSPFSQSSAITRDNNGPTTFISDSLTHTRIIFEGWWFPHLVFWHRVPSFWPCVVSLVSRLVSLLYLREKLPPSLRR